MGPRNASVRHPNVVVMAPALTEAGQSQNFKLTPSSISSQLSPISVSESSKCKQHHNQCLEQCSKRKPTGMNGVSSDTKHTVNGIALDKKSCVPYKRKISLNKSDLDKNIGLQDSDTTKSGQSLPSASEYQLLQIGGYMMNNSYPSMGDQEDNMGLHKSNSQVSNLDSNNYLKMDQILKNLGADLGGGGDIAQELFQVFKSMESSGNEVDSPHLDSGPSTEPEGMFQISDGADIAGSLVTFERDLFNDVDMMNMCVDENLGESSLMENKETVIKDKIDEVQKRQFQMERKCEWLLRRLRKMQVRAMSKHASEEITGLLEHVNQIVAENSSNVTRFGSSVLLSDIKIDNDKKARHLFSKNTGLPYLVQKLEETSQQQAITASHHHTACRYFGSGSSDNSTVLTLNNGLKGNTLPASVVPKFATNTRQDVEHVSGQLCTQLKMVESEMDSDVTASSSGGESCDEMQTYNNPHQQQLSISKRAAWRWAQDRAAVARRWSWLQAQISDLEYRIRQHSEAHRDLVANKGAVVLDGEDPPKLNDSVVVNGYHGTLPGASGVVRCSTDDDVICNSVSRTRPLVRSYLRKRKLVQMNGLHQHSKKAARPSTVKCGCKPPIPPCAVCTGRVDPTLPRELNDLLTVNERIALLDPAYHHVLSFPSDVSLSLHFDALMKTTDWQQKASRSIYKSQNMLRVLDQVDEDGMSLQDRRNKKQNVDHRKKYSSSLKKTTANALSEKIKMKLAKEKKTVRILRDPNNHNAMDRFKSRRRFGLKMPGGSIRDVIDNANEQGIQENNSLENITTPFIIVGGVTHPSPIPSPSLNNLQGANKERDGNSREKKPDVKMKKQLNAGKGRKRGVIAEIWKTPPQKIIQKTKKRKRENSYDIDNIVIPYSVASSARLEKLPYKEIPTPKWRIISVEPPVKLDTKNNGVVRRSSQESDMEDMSEETIISRHDRCEQEEKKKFSTYLKLPNSMVRSRGHRRTDSRTESSGANTPDPMSPNTVDQQGGGGNNSPLTSPPATPLSVVQDQENNTFVVSRKRTISLSRFKEKDESRCTTPDGHVDEVFPYEARTFPLPEEVYEKMLKAMPPGHPIRAYSSTVVPRVDSKDSEYGSRPVTPVSDSTESADTAIDEDPNDPEWTVDDSSLERVPCKR